MIAIEIDYHNLQFHLYRDGRVVDNPLPAQVQRVVIKQVIHDCAVSICRQLNEQLSRDPDVLRQSMVH